MATETAPETNHNQPKTHDSEISGNHKSARKPKSRVMAGAKTSKRHSHAPGSNNIAGRLAQSLTLDGLTSVAEGFSDHLIDLKDKGLQTAKALENRVVKHPKSSLLIAFGAGYIWARLRKWL
jgi:hypothetical protein